MWLLQLSKIKENYKFSFSVSLTTFQMRILILDGADHGTISITAESPVG